MPVPTLERLRAADETLWDVLEHENSIRTWQMVTIRDTRVLLYEMIKKLREGEVKKND